MWTFSVFLCPKLVVNFLYKEKKNCQQAGSYSYRRIPNNTRKMKARGRSTEIFLSLQRDLEKGGNVYRFIVLLPSGYAADTRLGQCAILLQPMNPLNYPSSRHSATALLKPQKKKKKQSCKFRVLPAEVVSTACPKGLEVGLND